MKGFERDRLMYEEGRESERKNTEKERKRADVAERELQNLKAKLEQMMRLQEKKEAT